MPRSHPARLRHLATFPFLLGTLAVLATCPARAQQTPGPRPQNPFLPPLARVFYAPDRDYDLKHVAVTLTVDYTKHAFEGTAANTLAPLRTAGLREIRLHCGKSLEVKGCEVDGKTAPFRRDGEFIIVTAPGVVAQNTDTTVSVHYTGGSKQGGDFGSDGGLHWINPTKTEPDRVGFWTQGETSGNREWCPTWDYPNDFATTETTVTVPEAWTVIGNGLPVSDTVNAGQGTRTVHWKMDQPHATYLLSLVAGPMDVKKTEWEGVPLYYVVPKGKAALIDPSFGDTPDMLSYFSKMTGVKFPWPKYAQNAVYDFGGGMENVSATTLGENDLTDARSGFREMASLNSHELMHQWFGDFVTCKDWGQIWLNESWATFGEIIYMEHSRGRFAYDREIESNTQQYLGEARRYVRPLATNLYPNPDALFDRHTYPKGGVLLHSLRRMLGDEAFFKGVNLYLTRNAHKPVESQDFAEALTEASGINVQPFFDQWIYKPGHPVLAYTSTYDDAKGELTVSVQQTQNTTNGTPIYDMNAQIGVIANGKLTRLPARLNAADQKITLKTPKPDAVLLDPDHNFLRDLSEPKRTNVENLAIARFAPNAVDRQVAFSRMLAQTPSADLLQAAGEIVRTDTERFPALADVSPLGLAKSENLRPLWREQLKHASDDRKAQAIAALSRLPASDEDTKTVRALAEDANAPYRVVAAAIRALGTWNATANLDLIKKAAQSPAPFGLGSEVRTAGFESLAKADPNVGVPLLTAAASSQSDPDTRAVALRALGGLGPDPRTQPVLRAALQDTSWNVALTAASAVAARGDKALLPDVQALEKKPPSGAPAWFGPAVGAIARRIESGKTGTVTRGNINE